MTATVIAADEVEAEGGEVLARADREGERQRAPRAATEATTRPAPSRSSRGPYSRLRQKTSSIRRVRNGSQSLSESHSRFQRIGFGSRTSGAERDRDVEADREARDVDDDEREDADRAAQERQERVAPEEIRPARPDVLGRRWNPQLHAHL